MEEENILDQMGIRPFDDDDEEEEATNRGGAPLGNTNRALPPEERLVPKKFFIRPDQAAWLATHDNQAATVRTALDKLMQTRSKT